MFIEVYLLESFKDLDYLGDTVLRFLAFKKRPEDPNKWIMRFGKNEYLAKLFTSVMGDDITLIKPDGKSIFVSSKKVPKMKKESRMIHLRASFVEYWLGLVYLESGFEGAEAFWDRINQVHVWQKEKLKTSSI